MKYPKISIVTPSFNQAEFLEQTICSVLNQNYPNLEYVIIDGGSTDGSVEIIKKYADRLTYWISEKDEGQYHAINKGFSYTTGEIMGWINSSDILYPWTFSTLVEVFEEKKEVKWIHGVPTKLVFGTAPQRIELPFEKNIFDFLGGNYRWIQQESVFWKRDLWIKAGNGLDTSVKYAGDFSLWLNFFKHERLYYLNTILGGFRFHEVRRGGGGASIYGKEASILLKKFKSELSFSQRLRGFIAGTFIRKNRMMGQLFKKSRIFPWYCHYKILYDFELHKWAIKKQ